MRQTNRLSLVLAAAASFAALGIAVVACSSDTSEPAAPTGTPYYAGTSAYPTLPPESGLEPPENLPVPTLTGEPTITASGLQIHDTQIGNGEEAQQDGIVYIFYTVWVEGGNQVDRTRTGPIRYRLAEGQLIDGLLEGLIGMKVGGHRMLIIPPDLAYGSAGSGNVIPPNATLIYDIEMTTAPTPEP